MTTARIVFQVCLVLILIGALNWGLVSMSPQNDIVLAIFPDWGWMRSLVYALIGMAGLIATYVWFSYPSDVCISDA